MEPLQLGLLAALTPSPVEVALYDDRVEPIPFDEPTDLVAITVETFTARRAYEIGAAFRRRGVPVVMGGFHPTLLPSEAADHADAIVVGDAESVWSRVVADAESGRLAPVYRGTDGRPQAGVLPRRELFAGKGYLPISLIQFGRGCTQGCRFCAVSAASGRRHRVRPVADIVREIESQERRTIFFVDDNIVADLPAARELMRALIPLQVRWFSQATVDMVHDRDLMDLMARSGCLGHVIGFESVSPDALAEMGKTVNLRGFDGYRREVEILREYGLQTWVAFTLGHDHDTPETLQRTLDFALESKFTFAAFNLLTPYPGTALYARLQAERRHLFGGRWWLHPDYRFNHATFEPRGMSARRLTEACFELRRQWSRPRSILKRFFEPRTNLRSPRRMALYWVYNSLFRREVFRKQDMRLGFSREAGEHHAHPAHHTA